ncbi:hypothetical protein [Burkholderia stagnalis]|uniref:hypothetical protein n=1 Tax=Burkholderia stagnalis TaxID=1503054 RepID=UPI001E4B3E5E|nr:hypothetical protein [Burkholderia stagnalis]
MVRTNVAAPGVRACTRVNGVSAPATVRHPGDDWAGFRGTPVDALGAALAQADVLPDLYACGPPALVRGAQEAAAAAGVPDALFASERFIA